MTPYEYPEDEFDSPADDGPDPIGVHREPVPAWRSWLPLLAVLIIVPLLAWGAVSLLGSRSGSPTETTTTTTTASTASATPTATASATLAGDADMTTGITVHNGTSTQGLGTRTGEKLTNAGFTAVTVSQGVYSLTDPTATTIYYASPDDESTAQAVAQTLGVTNVVESAAEAQSNPIVVVLRDDYQE
ncbi:LytR C-terminal domain-containing protein [Actinomyces radicidentis]|uniref:LytR C-terminal domain-containing protein n=1 Tax=Actinomyces radicidentis TaxID=111015 RepID=UPI0028E3FF13|nr:LytR C-terminal domain-containing protein [Actinomyces radicidentis]